jgi:hypothetical protein
MTTMPFYKKRGYTSDTQKPSNPTIERQESLY